MVISHNFLFFENKLPNICPTKMQCFILKLDSLPHQNGLLLHYFYLSIIMLCFEIFCALDLLALKVESQL